MFALANACGSDRPDQPKAGVDDCPAERCVGLSEASSALHFDVLEPQRVPEGFQIYSRQMVGAGGGPPSSYQGQEAMPPGFDYSSIQLDYRFRDSLTVPGIILIESAISADGEPSLRLAGADCGEEISRDGVTIFYLDGLGDLQGSPESGDWTICKSDAGPPRSLHSVYALTGGGVLIEAMAFPESRVTREDMISIIESLKAGEASD